MMMVVVVMMMYIRCLDEFWITPWPFVASTFLRSFLFRWGGWWDGDAIDNDDDNDNDDDDDDDDDDDNDDDDDDDDDVICWRKEVQRNMIWIALSNNLKQSFNPSWSDKSWQQTNWCPLQFYNHHLRARRG